MNEININLPEYVIEMITEAAEERDMCVDQFARIILLEWALRNQRLQEVM